MAKSYAKAKARREKGGFLALPHAVIRSEKFAALSPRATKLLIDMLASYRGNNNGDFEITYATLSTRGWKSRSMLAKARDELLESGFVLQSRQGGRHKCGLFAVSFFAIDDCGGKLDIPATRVPPGDWKK